jgi:hypothetical protein
MSGFGRKQIKRKILKLKKIPSLAQHDNFDQRAKFSYTTLQ